jgi:glyoxylase-like metal-dependent hydrolase (beta-lactamase superfamily II)
MERTTSMEIVEHQAKNGAQIFQIPLEVFPGFWAYVYVVITPSVRALVDVGSGFGDANHQLEAGFRSISELLGVSFSLADLTHVFITHGHIDHFGGLRNVAGRTGALVGIHELDRRNISNYEERIIISCRSLDSYLVEAGVNDDKRQALMEMYSFHKALYHSLPVDFTYEKLDMRLDPFEFLHVPGHCAGHIVIRCGDILFSGDHVLSDISPHQAPEKLTLHTGLSHYLESLDKVVNWAGDVVLTLGGHRAPIQDLPARVAEIKTEHMDRLTHITDLLAEPRTIAEIASLLFGPVEGYNELLALEEAGAHVEYLYQRNHIGIANYQDLEAQPLPIAVKYLRL